MFLHRGDRYAHALGSRDVVQALQLDGQEDLPGSFAQAIEQGIHGHQGFEDQQAGFRRVGKPLGTGRQLGEVGLLEGLAAELVDHQRMGDGAQVAARFANGVHIAGGQHPDKGVLGEVRGIAGIAQAGA
ncbi:hypothetical protein D3C77_657140 [compost metagenome]